MSNKHTPGPWAVEVVSSYGQFEIRSLKERDLMDEATLQADARLIAAAPELLEACEAALEVVTDDVVQGILNEALAKAEGRDNE